MHRVRLLHIVALLMLLFSCSRTTQNLKKNTWTTRTYHNTTSKYNIYFNGNEAYEEGVASIEDRNVDDFSRVLPIFEDGIHENFSSVEGNMDYAIEKANKIIQLHSIKIKPEYNRKKIKDPEYREWRSQEEFNKMIDDAYIMMGKATFYKGQFLESIGIFSHVVLKYPGEDAWYLANLWIARAYAEMGWLYEAENMLTLVNDENLPYQYLKFYNIVSADLSIKRAQYAEAIPFLRSALEGRFKRAKRQRYEFILAQIYQEVGQNNLAYETYKGVVRSIPNYEMELYARIRMTEVMDDTDSRRAVKKLKKMLKDPKNLEYQGQLYYALGNIYNKSGHNALAIENYRLSLAFSTDLQQGVTSYTIAKLYWEDRDYLGAQPYYGTATENLPVDYPNAREIAYRSNVLSQLADYYDVMGDTDREYILSQMTEAEKADFLDKEEKAAEREDEILELIALASGELKKEEDIAEDRKEVAAGSWYFYNDKLVESGKDEFQKQWGDRPLKDNWRRSMSQDFSELEDIADDAVEVEATDVASAAVDDTAPVVSLEEKELEERIKKAASNKAIVDAYFNLAALYQYDIEDYAKAVETYEALEAQFPSNPHSPDSYFAIYNSSIALGDQQKAESAKQVLLRDYPNSNYALILTDPNAKDLLLADKEAYNKLYEETFDLFVNGKNYEVLANTRQLKAEFRDSTLQPKVLFMEALAIAKTDYSADIRPQLEYIVANYSYDKEVFEQATIILSQLEKGEKITLGGSAANTLAERRNETAAIERQKILAEQQYKYEPESRHYMVFVIVDSLNVNRNYLQFDVSKFNFNKFMTMDFDLSFSQLNEETSLLIINGFSNEEEGKWYQSQFLSTDILNNYDGIKKMYVISEENFRLLLLLGTLEEYDTFDNKH